MNIPQYSSAAAELDEARSSYMKQRDQKRSDPRSVLSISNLISIDDTEPNSGARNAMGTALAHRPAGPSTCEPDWNLGNGVIAAQRSYNKAQAEKQVQRDTNSDGATGPPCNFGSGRFIAQQTHENLNDGVGIQRSSATLETRPNVKGDSKKINGKIRNLNTIRDHC